MKKETIEELNEIIRKEIYEKQFKKNPYKFFLWAVKLKIKAWLMRIGI